MTYLLLALVALGVFSAIIALLSHNKEGGGDVVIYAIVPHATATTRNANRNA